GHLGTLPKVDVSETGDLGTLPKDPISEIGHLGTLPKVDVSEIGHLGTLPKVDVSEIGHLGTLPKDPISGAGRSYRVRLRSRTNRRPSPQPIPASGRGGRWPSGEASLPPLPRRGGEGRGEGVDASDSARGLGITAPRATVRPSATRPEKRSRRSNRARAR